MTVVLPSFNEKELCHLVTDPQIWIFLGVCNRYFCYFYFYVHLYLWFPPFNTHTQVNTNWKRCHHTTCTFPWIEYSITSTLLSPYQNTCQWILVQNCQLDFNDIWKVLKKSNIYYTFKKSWFGYSTCKKILICVYYRSF